MDDAKQIRSILERSVHTELAVGAPRPLLRGVSHLMAAVVAVPATVVAVVLTPGVIARLAVGAFAGGIAAMFTASALLHRRPWPPHLHERLLRLDHTGIYLAIGGTAVAVALLGFDGWAGAVLLMGTLIGVTLGISVEWLPFALPRGYSNTVYLTLGWMPMLLLPWLWMASGATTVGLLMLGGAFYTCGAVIVGLRRPDPVPRVFGYHELFHVLVIAAVTVHAIMIARLV